MTNNTEGRGVNIIDQWGRSLPTALEHVIMSAPGNIVTHWAHRPGIEITADLGTVAAEIEKACILIPRAELPETDVVHGGYGKLIEVRDSQRGRWSATDSPEHVRKIGLEYLAAAEAITAHQAAEKSAEAEDARRLDARRDAITQELTQTDGVTYASRTNVIRRAVDRIIELEDHQPKGN